MARERAPCLRARLTNSSFSCRANQRWLLLVRGMGGWAVSFSSSLERARERAPCLRARLTNSSFSCRANQRWLLLVRGMGGWAALRYDARIHRALVAIIIMTKQRAKRIELHLHGIKRKTAATS